MKKKTYIYGMRSTKNGAVSLMTRVGIMSANRIAPVLMRLQCGTRCEVLPPVLGDGVVT